VCTGGDGWVIHGVYCSSGQLTAFRFSNAFGVLVGTPTFDFTEFTALSNFTSVAVVSDHPFPNLAAFNEFLVAASTAPSLKYVDITWLSTAVGFPSSLFETLDFEKIRLQLPNGSPGPSFQGKAYLEEVNINFEANFADFENSAATLRSLIISGVVQNISGLANLQLLEYLDFKAPTVDTPSYSETVEIPPNLAFLKIQGWGSETMSITSSGSNLKALTLTGLEFTIKSISELPMSGLECSL
jgi:hypothetical protein